MNAKSEVYLPEDIFLCVAQGHAVFLDLRRDTYSAVYLWSEDDAADWPGLSCLSGALRPHLAELIAAGLLSTDPTGRDLGSVADVGAITAHICGEERDDRAFGGCGVEGDRVHVSIMDVVRFVRASWTAQRLLRRRHIAAIVHAVHRRKTNAPKINRDAAELRRRVAVFARLRPWYPRSYLCLFDSLALVRFLAASHFYPTWVFGVQAEPFGAHCWLQADDVLLNEGREYAGQFIPIMTV